MSWEDIVKFERNPYFDGKSYLKQIEQIAEDIEKVIKFLRKHPDSRNLRVTTVIDMLEEINTRVD